MDRSFRYRISTDSYYGVRSTDEVRVTRRCIVALQTLTATGFLRSSFKFKLCHGRPL